MSKIVNQADVILHVAIAPTMLSEDRAIQEGHAEPSAAAVITRGQDGLHGAAALVEPMTPASHGWTTAVTAFRPGS